MSTALSLYGHITELERIDRLAESEDKELATVEIMLAIQHKTADVIGYVKHLEDMVELCDKQIDKINDAKKRLLNKSDFLQSNVLACMDIMRVDKIEAGINSVKIRKPTQIVFITDVEKVPDEFKRVNISVNPDKKLIAEKLKQGECIESCSLIDGKRSLIFK